MRQRGNHGPVAGESRAGQLVEMPHALAIQLLARFVVLWLLARAILAYFGLWLSATRTMVLLSLVVPALLLLDLLRRRERVLLANLGLSLPVLYGIAVVISFALEVALTLVLRALSGAQ